MAASHDHRRRGGLLWHRNFRLLWSGETVSMLGSAMASVALPLLAIKVLHASTFVVAALFAASYLPYLVIGLPAGVYIDRFRPRPVLIWSDVAALVLYASLPILQAVGVLAVWQLVVVAVLAGTATLFFRSAYSIYLRHVIEPAELIEGNAKMSGTASVTGICGPGLGGLVSQVVGPGAALLANAVSFLASAGCIGAIDRAVAPEDRANRDTTLLEEIKEGIAFVVHDRYLRVLTGWAALINVGLTGYFALIVVFLVRSVGLSSGAVGALMTLGGVGGLVGAFVTSRLTARFGTARTFVVNCAVTCPCALLVPFASKGTGIVLAAAGILMLEGGLVVGTIILTTFRQTYCPPGILGRVATSGQMVTYGIVPLAALVAGALGESVGPRRALFVMLLFEVAAVILLLVSPFARQREMPEYQLADVSPTAPLAREHDEVLRPQGSGAGMA